MRPAAASGCGAGAALSPSPAGAARAGTNASRCVPRSLFTQRGSAASSGPERSVGPSAVP